jgi:hypothetical protein
MTGLWACNPLNLPEEPGREEIRKSYEGLETRTFNVFHFVKEEYYQVEAVRLAEGANRTCIVYGERNAYVSLNRAQRIAEEFSRNILPVISGTFDPEKRLADLYGPVILLLLDIQDGYHKFSNTYINGFFNFADLYSPETGDAYAYSNQAKMLYLDTNPQTPGSEDFYATIAHELQHMISHFYAVNRGQLQDIWIDEGLSTAAEYIYAQKHLQRHVDHFNRDPYGTLQRGNTFFIWDDNAYVGDEYVTAYLFFQWLRIQAREDVKIYQDIIMSPHTGWRAVAEAAEKHIDPRFSSWETLLRTWFLANYVNIPDKNDPGGLGLLGYNGKKEKIELKPKAIGMPLQELLPGEGVYSVIKDSFSPPAASASPNIRYAGITKKGAESLGEVLLGDWLLTFNVNPNPSGKAEAGNLTGAGKSQSVSRNIKEPPFPADYLPGPRNLPLRPLK